MNKIAIALLLLLTLSGCSSYGFSGVSIGNATSAAADLYKAADISDEEVKNMAALVSKQSDAQNKVLPAGNKYTQRLNRLVARHKSEDGLSLNFKVYNSPEVNAFALANGSIRVYSGLMDLMTDQELLGVIGHEIGHVKDGHSKAQMRTAYLASAARKGVASYSSVAGSLAASELGALGEELVNAQYSQSDEKDADEYGLVFLKRNKYKQEAMVSALEKLAKTGGSGGFLSSHPDPKDRAERIAKEIKS